MSGRHRPETPKPDTSWFTPPDDLIRSFESAVSDSVHSILSSERTRIYFPAEWTNSNGLGGASVDDPLTIYLRADVEGQDEPSTYEFSLREALSSTLQHCVDDGSFSPGLGRIAAAFRDMADEIESARAKHPNPST